MIRKLLATSMLAALACNPQPPSTAMPQAGLSFPLTVAGDCRDETCVRGSWLACLAVAVQNEPGSSSRAIAKISAGEAFSVSRSSTVISVPGIVRVVRDISRTEGSGDRFNAGDTVLVLDYQGEGKFGVAHKGRITITDVFWPWDSGANSARSNSGEILQTRQSEFWLRVTTSEDISGWVLKDSLGMLDPLEQIAGTCRPQPQDPPAGPLSPPLRPAEPEPAANGRSASARRPDSARHAKSASARSGIAGARALAKASEATHTESAGMHALRAHASGVRDDR